MKSRDGGHENIPKGTLVTVEVFLMATRILSRTSAFVFLAGGSGILQRCEEERRLQHAFLLGDAPPPPSPALEMHLGTRSVEDGGDGLGISEVISNQNDSMIQSPCFCRRWLGTLSFGPTDPF